MLDRHCGGRCFRQQNACTDGGGYFLLLLDWQRALRLHVALVPNDDLKASLAGRDKYKCLLESLLTSLTILLFINVPSGVVCGISAQ